MQTKKLPNGVDTAASKAAKKDDACKKAHDANKAQRNGLKGKPTRVSGTTNSSGVNGCGVTISSGVFSFAGGDSYTITGQSNYTSLTTDVVGNVAEGNAPSNRPDGSALECGDETHQYAENGSAYSCTCNGGHGEARVLDTLPELSALTGQGLSGSSLVLNIDWRNKKGGKMKHPCPDCYRMICYALECNMAIKICRNEKDKDPVDMREKCKNENGYADLLADLA